MSKYSFPDTTLLIVDDENFSRIAVLRLLKNLGDPNTLSATNGLEAITTLEKRKSMIDCVIADFNMPVMHGLQLLKKIRMGENNVSRNLPVIMLTGHGEASLVNLAIQLDVNTFILKPATVDSIGSRLQEVLSMDKNDDAWLKPIEEYEKIDVDTPINDILKKNALSQISEQKSVKIQVREIAVGIEECELQNIKEWNIIAKNISGPSGQVFVNAGTQVTTRLLEQLKSLQDMGLMPEKIWIKK